MVAMEAALAVLAVLLGCSVAGGDGNMVEENNFDGDWINIYRWVLEEMLAGSASVRLLNLVMLVDAGC